MPKHIYPFERCLTKNFILIEEDMEIYNDSENENLWRSNVVTKELLSSLYMILQNLALHDCAKPSNIPFSHDGRIAFIDTLTWNEWSVKYKKLTPYLSPEMQKYWQQLIN